jgi:integrase
VTASLDVCAQRSIGYRKMAHAALRAFFVATRNRPEIVANIPWPRVAPPLREPPRLAELHGILLAVSDLRCRTALRVIVRAGLRTSEVCALSVDDIIVERDAAGRRADIGVFRVVRGKGGKSRFVPLSRTLLSDLREVNREVRPMG